VHIEKYSYPEFSRNAVALQQSELRVPANVPGDKLDNKPLSKGNLIGPGRRHKVQPYTDHSPYLAKRYYKLFTIQMIKQIINKLPRSPYPNIVASRRLSPSYFRTSLFILSGNHNRDNRLGGNRKMCSWAGLLPQSWNNWTCMALRAPLQCRG
jgi:hypothetical protein